MAVTGDGTETLILTGSIADLNAFIDGNQLNFNATS